MCESGLIVETDFMPVTQLLALLNYIVLLKNAYQEGGATEKLLPESMVISSTSEILASCNKHTLLYITDESLFLTCYRQSLHS